MTSITVLQHSAKLDCNICRIEVALFCEIAKDLLGVSNKWTLFQHLFDGQSTRRDVKVGYRSCVRKYNV